MMIQGVALRWLCGYDDAQCTPEQMEEVQRRATVQLIVEADVDALWIHDHVTTVILSIGNPRVAVWKRILPIIVRELNRCPHVTHLSVLTSRLLAWTAGPCTWIQHLTFEDRSLTFHYRGVGEWIPAFPALVSFRKETGHLISPRQHHVPTRSPCATTYRVRPGVAPCEFLYDRHNVVPPFAWRGIVSTDETPLRVPPECRDSLESLCVSHLDVDHLVATLSPHVLTELSFQVHCEPIADVARRVVACLDHFTRLTYLRVTYRTETLPTDAEEAEAMELMHAAVCRHPSILFLGGCVDPAKAVGWPVVMLDAADVVRQFIAFVPPYDSPPCLK